MSQSPRDTQYPQYKGVNNSDLRSKIAANERKMAAMEPSINAAKAKLRLAEQEKRAAVDKLKANRGYTNRELFDVGKKLSKNPNDPQALAEKARLKGLREQYIKKIEPYQKAEEKALEQVKEASDGYTDLWAENGDIDHAMRLSQDPNAEWGDSDELWESGLGTGDTNPTAVNAETTEVKEKTTVTEEPVSNATSQEVNDTLEKVEDAETTRASRDETTSTGGVQESTDGTGAGKVVSEESAEGSEELEANSEEEVSQKEKLKQIKEDSEQDDLDVYNDDSAEEVGKVSTDYPYDTDINQEDEGIDEEEDPLNAFGGSGDDIDDPKPKDVAVDYDVDTPPEIRPNVLNQFVNYTYHLELYVLGSQDYNSFVTDPKFRIEEQRGRLLIKSGGGGNDMRNAYFKLDYYMDNLELYSVVSPRGNNIGGTNVELSFNITEPYGMTLLNSLVMACKELGSFNYIDQPYLLKISFKGYDAEGNVAKMDSPAMTRYVPIRLTDLQFSASNEGTEYRCRAMVYHSIGLQNTKATVPSDIQIEATTVGEFFLKQMKTISKKEVVKTSQDMFSDYAYREEVEVVEQTQGGLAGFLNNLEKEYVKAGTKSVADVYAFEIDEDIGNAKILLQNLVEIRKIKNDKDPRKIALGQYLNNFQFNEERQNFTIRAGTNLPTVIHSILRTTEYMINQVNLENTSGSKKDSLKYSEGQDKPILFYRIVPRIELIDEWDIKRNCYAKKITYVIKKHKLRGKDYENLGQAQITNFVKTYKYIYTGENTEILNFDIQFNAAYYQKNLFGIMEKTRGSATSKAAAMEDALVDHGNLATTNPNGTTNVTPVMKETSVAVPGSTDINTPIVDPKTLIVNNFMNDVMNSGADLVELNLEILGDPSYIQNHDIRHAVLASQGFPAMDPETRSLNPDREWHVTVEFRNPVDINERTGLYEGFGVNDKGVAVVTAPTMSGIYKAVEVRSKFNNGVFTQSLQLVRERLQTASLADEQEQDPSKNVAANNSAKGPITKQKDETPTMGKSTAPHLEGKHSGLSMAEGLLGDKPVSMTADAQGINVDDLVEEDVDYIGDADADTGNWQPPGSKEEIGSGSEIQTPTSRPDNLLTGTAAPKATQTVTPKPPMPQHVTADSVTGGYRAFNPKTGRARGFSTLAEAEAFTKGG